MEADSNYPKQSALNQRAIHIAAAIALLAALILPVPHDGSLAGLPSLCVFHHVTGILCPSCGMTRSIVCCAHGLWQEAVTYHPLGPLFFVAMLHLAFAPLINKLYPRRLPSPPLQIASRSSVLAIGTVPILFLIIWIARLIGLLPSPP